MSAAELLMDLGRLGIRLEADGERLRYRPQSALTPDLLDRLKAHKTDVLALLRPRPDFDVDNAPDAEPATIIDPATTTKADCRCGSTTWRDVPIHDGQSIRRDCGHCGRFVEFVQWYGNRIVE